MKQELYAWVRKRSLAKRVSSLRNFLRAPERKTTPLPPSTKALVLAPHPDDESIGCGGTLGLIREQGGTFDIAFLTDGAAGGNADLSGKRLVDARKAEAEQATKVLGVNKIFFLDQPDSKLHFDTDETASRVSKIIGEANYDIIFCPWPYDGHSDHEAAFRILFESLKLTPRFKGQVWLYEVWNPLIPNRFVDISDFYSQKRKAIECYESQIAGTNYLDAFSSLARYRSLMVPGAQYVEAFLEGDRKFILSLGKR